MKSAKNAYAPPEILRVARFARLLGDDNGRGHCIEIYSITSAPSITIGSTGTSSYQPTLRVAVAAMASTTSMPLVTAPNAAYSPSRYAASACMIKN